jgi:hypothetical protein
MLSVPSPLLTTCRACKVRYSVCTCVQAAATGAFPPSKTQSLLPTLPPTAPQQFNGCRLCPPDLPYSSWKVSWMCLRAWASSVKAARGAVTTRAKTVSPVQQTATQQHVTLIGKYYCTAWCTAVASSADLLLHAGHRLHTQPSQCRIAGDPGEPQPS